MTRDEALALVREYVKNEGLVRHMLSVEAAMRFYAEKFGEDPETWGLVGLLHDFDWEIHPTLYQHPQDGADHLSLPRDTLRRKAICACDEITGLITAVALVRPSKSLYDLEASSVKKKWKDKAFAAGTSRTEMEHAAQEFGIELWEHVRNVITAMRKIAPELGLVGNIQQ